MRAKIEDRPLGFPGHSEATTRPGQEARSPSFQDQEGGRTSTSRPASSASGGNDDYSACCRSWVFVFGLSHFASREELTRRQEGGIGLPSSAYQAFILPPPPERSFPSLHQLLSPIFSSPLNSYLSASPLKNTTMLNTLVLATLASALTVQAAVLPRQNTQEASTIVFQGRVRLSELALRR